MTLRVGLVGIGMWGPNILRNLLENENVEVTLLCDSNEKRLVEIAKKFRLYGKSILAQNVKDVKSSDCDAIFISTPAKTHYEIARHFLNMGKHTFVEKPLAMNVSDALELCTIADLEKDGQYVGYGNERKDTLKLLTGHVFLYSESVKKIKELIKDDKILYMYFTWTNLGRIQEDINSMWSLAPHSISIANYLMDGTPVKDGIQATGCSFVTKGIEDVVFMNLTYEGDRMAHIHASWLDPLKTRSCVIVCQKKMIVWSDTDNEAPIKVYDKGAEKDYLAGDERLIYTTKLRSGDIYIPKIQIKEPLREEINHFISAIINDTEVFTNGLQGLQVVEILEQAQKSLKISENI